MNEFDLKDYLKDNKLLKEEKKPIIVESITIASILAVIKPTVLLKYGAAFFTTLSFYLTRSVWLPPFFKWYDNVLRKQFNLSRDEVSKRIGKRILSWFKGTLEGKDKREARNSVLVQLKELDDQISTNKYTFKNGIEIPKLKSRLDNDFLKLDTRDYTTIIKDLEEGIVILDKCLDIMTTERWVAALDNNPEESEEALKIWQSFEKQWKALRDLLRGTLKYAKELFELYKKSKSSGTVGTGNVRIKKG